MDSNRIGLTVGPSTGWMYAKGIYSLARQGRILEEAGANGAEICLDRCGGKTDSRRIMSLKGAGGGVFAAQGLDYQSLHLPDVNDKQSEHRFVTAARELVALCGAVVAVIHPLKIKGDYPTEYYESMISVGIPLALENMDLRKDSGFKLEELFSLMAALGCSFVLDVQHAYEHDPTMKYAGELLESLKGNLVHLHVSGETADNIHSLVCKAANAARIVDFVGRALSAKNVPLILEGEYTTSGEIRQEIEFLTKELGLAD